MHVQKFLKDHPKLQDQKQTGYFPISSDIFKNGKFQSVRQEQLPVSKYNQRGY